MSGLLLGSGRKYRFRELEFWAESGQIHMLDYRKGPYDADYTVMTVPELVERVKAFQVMLDRFKYADERREHEQLIESLLAAGVEARSQGDAVAPEVSAHRQRHKTRKGHFLVPGEGIAAGNFVRWED